MLGWLSFILMRGERRRAIDQLVDRYEYLTGRRSTPPAVRRRWARRVARGVFGNLGRWAGEICSLADRPHLLSRRIHVPVRSRKVLERASTRGRGVLFLTGHLGNWELVAWAVASLGYPASAVGRRSYHEGITDLVHSLRQGAGVEVMYREDPSLARQLLGALQGGRIVGLLVDPSTDLPSRRVAFLGRAAPTMQAPARLSLRHAGAVVFGWCHESRTGRLEVEIEPVVVQRTMTVEEAMRSINVHVERAVTARPDHWIWMHPRWDARR